jgi:alpha-mannosidase
MKKSEGGDFVTLRFYEAEGEACTARIHMSKNIREAWRTNLLEENEEPLHLTLQASDDGGMRLPIRPYEIVTIKVAV